MTPESSGVWRRATRPGGHRSIALLSAAAVVVLAACSGGGSGTAAGASSGSANEGTPQKGGTLNILGSGDVDYLDPNLTYYSPGYMVSRIYARTLYSYPADPNNTRKGQPDLADGPPQLSADGLTATVKIRQGVKWNSSPPR